MKPYHEAAGITIYHGDCREILPSLGMVDLVLTDPPYAVSVAGAAHHGKPGRGARNLDFFDGDSDWPATRMLVREALRLAVDRLGERGSVYAWIGHRCFGDMIEDFEERGFSTRFLVWKKTCPAPAPPGAGWPSAAELCVYGYRPGRTWNGSPRSNVLESDSFRHGQPGKVAHPTQKPERVITPLIAASSNEGETLLDPFMGSGTTLVAARDMGRRAIGIELEERYCEVAARRLAQGVLF